MGKLAGRYFNLDGSPTPYYRQLQEWMLGAKNDAQSVENEKKIFPPCNSEWNADTGQRVWCTKKSGGIQRDWVGVPRKLFFLAELNDVHVLKTLVLHFLNLIPMI